MTIISYPNPDRARDFRKGMRRRTPKQAARFLARALKDDAITLETLARWRAKRMGPKWQSGGTPWPKWWGPLNVPSPCPPIFYYFNDLKWWAQMQIIGARMFANEEPPQ